MRQLHKVGNMVNKKQFPIFLALLFCVTPIYPQGVITTLAGTDWLFPGDGRPALNAPISSTTGLDLAVDRNGNYYLADPGNFMVMRVGSDGIVNVIAGNGVNFISGDGGLAVNAATPLPTAVAVDSAGNVYIAQFTGRVRKVTLDGIITNFAGNGQNGFSGDGGLAVDAQLNRPHGLAVDSAGNVYISDTDNNRIRRVTPAGIITTVAGNGNQGLSGNNAMATSVPLNTPTRLAVDAVGNLYIVEFFSPGGSQSARVRKVDTNGVITTVVGGGGSLLDGVPATQAEVAPLAIGVDSAGNLYVIDVLTQAVRKVDTTGKISTIAGGSGETGFSGDEGPARQAVFNFQLYPAIAVDSSGNVLIVDEGNNRIRKITADGLVHTIAGNDLFHFSGNGGLATSATLDYPVGLLEDAAGNLYVTEAFVGRIRRVAKDGTISVLAGTGRPGYSGDNGPATSATLDYPAYMIFGPDGSLVFSELSNCVIRAIDAKGIVRTIAGHHECNFGGDGGPAIAAAFNGPEGLAFDALGNLFVADTYNNRIRMILAPPDGRVFTIAGTGEAGFSGDGGDAQKARLDQPVGLRLHDNGIYFSDYNNHRIRRIDRTSMVITTVAGNGTPAPSGDGGPAAQASLNLPEGIHFDPAGNLFVADTGNRLIRKIDPQGIITTVAGSRTAKTSGDGGLAINAQLGGPGDVFTDPAGNLLLTDTVLARVRVVLANPPSLQASPSTVAFSAPAGSTSVDQHIDITGSIPGIPFSVSAASLGWLQAAVSSSNAPASIQITADPSKLAPGPYAGAITIATPNATPPTQSIQVSLTVTAPGQPSLSVKPSALSFSFVHQAAAASRAITVSNVGGGSLAFTAAVTATGGSWLTVSAPNGTAGPFALLPVTITADPSGLPPGTYSGTVTFSSASPAQSVDVPVTMTVTAVQQTMLIPQSGLTFFAVQGGGAPPPQFFSILNSGIGQMPFSTSSTMLSGADWISAFPPNGLSDAGSTIVPQVRVDVNASSLNAGIYYGTVQVTAPSADNNPQFVSVVLNILPPGSKLGPIVEPTGLVFTAAAGGQSPGSQTIVVQSTTDTPARFSSGVATSNGGNWLTLLPASGTVSQAQPARIVVQPEIPNLTPGVYRGTVTLSFSDGNTRIVSIVLVVVPPGTVVSSTPLLRQAQSSCFPTILVTVFTQLSSGFTVNAGFPGQVAVRAVDDCGTAMTAGGITVSFSNGDAPLRLISLKDGNWAATWTPQRAVSPITVTADAAISELNLSGRLQITGGLQSTDQTPIVNADGTLNAASLTQQAPIAPGSYIAVFGSQLAQGQASAPSVPLPNTLAGSTLLLAGVRVPLAFASDGQMNALVPYGIAVNTTHQVIVSRGASISVPQRVTVAAAAPGIFTRDGSGKGQGIILGVGADGTQTFADAAHPVRSGDAIVIYCTGLGEVSPPVTAGSATPLSPLSTTVNPVTLTIGGISSNVSFAGLAPGSTGLYQVNAIVPEGVATGGQVPVVITAAGQQNRPVTIAVR